MPTVLKGLFKSRKLSEVWNNPCPHPALWHNYSIKITLKTVLFSVGSVFALISRVLRHIVSHWVVNSLCCCALSV